MKEVHVAGWVEEGGGGFFGMQEKAGRSLC